MTFAFFRIEGRSDLINQDAPALFAIGAPGCTLVLPEKSAWTSPFWTVAGQQPKVHSQRSLVNAIGHAAQVIF